jgi:plasmid stabilization system protein ParE
LSESALADLTEIFDFVADHDGIERAILLHAEFVAAFERIGEFPGLGALRPGITRPSLRWWTVHSFLVVYEAVEMPVTVLRVVHGARLLTTIFDR